jgi:hypothetical protein
MIMPSPIHRRENRVNIRAPTLSICAAFAIFALELSCVGSVLRRLACTTAHDMHVSGLVVVCRAVDCRVQQCMMREVEYSCVLSLGVYCRGVMIKI